MSASALDLTRPDLRRLVVAQLPDRVERLCQRGRRLAASGWDVNVMALLIDDANLLARMCRPLGAETLASRIEALRDAMHLLLADSDPPDARAAAEIVCLVNAIGAEKLTPAGNVGADTLAHGALAHDALAHTASGAPDFSIDRDAAAHDWAARDADAFPVAAARADHGGTAYGSTSSDISATAADPDHTPSQLHVIHVSRGDAFADTIDRLLTARGERVARYASTDAALQKIDPALPTLLLIDHDFAIELAPIEAALRRLRAHGRKRLVVIALTAHANAADRVHALRIGCDALIELPASAETVVERLLLQMQMQQGDPYRVLIVNDDLAQARFADSVLSSAGLQTRVIADALDTIDEIERFHPDLILMDLYMAGCDGIELTTLIRQRRSNASISILFLSSEHSVEKHLDALKAGGDDFLSKPVQPRQLINAVTGRIHRARAHAQRAAASANVPARVVDAMQLMRRLTELIADDDARAGIGGLIAMRAPPECIDRDSLTAIAAFVAGKANTRDIVALDNVRGLLVLAEDCASTFLDAYALGLREAIAARNFGTRGVPSIVFEIGTCAFDAGVVSADGMRAVAIAAITGADIAAIEPLSDTLDSVVADPSTASLHAGASEGASEAVIVEDIRLALAGDGFSLLFQPIVSLRGDEEEQFQALLRLRGSSGAAYSAAQVVPVAERADLIGAIDRWTLETALSMLAARAQNGCAARLIVSQSLRTRSASGLDVVAIEDGLRRHALNAAALVLDFRADDLARHRSREPLINSAVPRAKDGALVKQARKRLLHGAVSGPGPDTRESDQVNDGLDQTFHRLIETFASIRELGVRLALAAVDDVESAVSLLAAIRFDYVRLGARFAQIDADSVRDDLRALVARAHERGARVIAPRIEDARGAATMWTLGLDYIQGHFVQPPDASLAFDFRASAG